MRPGQQQQVSQCAHKWLVHLCSAQCVHEGHWGILTLPALSSLCLCGESSLAWRPLHLGHDNATRVHGMGVALL